MNEGNIIIVSIIIYLCSIFIGALMFMGLWNSISLFMDGMNQITYLWSLAICLLLRFTIGSIGTKISVERD